MAVWGQLSTRNGASIAAAVPARQSISHNFKISPISFSSRFWRQQATSKSTRKVFPPGTSVHAPTAATQHKHHLSLLLSYKPSAMDFLPSQRLCSALIFFDSSFAAGAHVCCDDFRLRSLLCLLHSTPLVPCVPPLSITERLHAPLFNLFPTSSRQDLSLSRRG